MPPTLEAVREAGIDNPEDLAGLMSDGDVLALMEEASKADEPGLAPLGLGLDGKPVKDASQVIFRGDAETPAVIMSTALKSAGYAEVWDPRTGERSVISKNNLPGALRKRHPDGSRVFVTRRPSVVPVRGTLTCPLHADRPERAEYELMGLPACPKRNLPTQMAVRLHLRNRHKSAYEAIEEQKRLQREDEERAGRQALLALAQQSAPRPGGKGG